MNNPVKSVADINKGQETTVEVSGWYSTCRACGKGADPRETRHLTRLGYGDVGDGRGCGATFTKIAPAMTDFDGFWDAVRAMRPDLEFIG